MFDCCCFYSDKVKRLASIKLIMHWICMYRTYSVSRSWCWFFFQLKIHFIWYSSYCFAFSVLTIRFALIRFNWTAVVLFIIFSYKRIQLPIFQVIERERQSNLSWCDRIQFRILQIANCKFANCDFHIYIYMYLLLFAMQCNAMRRNVSYNTRNPMNDLWLPQHNMYTQYTLKLLCLMLHIRVAYALSLTFAQTHFSPIRATIFFFAAAAVFFLCAAWALHSPNAFTS